MSARRPRPRHAVVHLPPLDATSALSLVNALDAMIAAIWRAHGEAILDLQADLTTEAPRAPARRATDDDGF